MSAPETAAHAYEYAVLRCVPRPEREEFVNVGVVLHCRGLDFLAVAWHVDRDRLMALAPTLDCGRVEAALTFVDGVAAGDARGGGAATQPMSTRFGFLKAPRSTVIQPGPVHSGVTSDPTATLSHLLTTLVT